MKFLITGGHLTPAYAFAEYAAFKGDQLDYISSDTSSSLEASEISRLHVRYHHLSTIKFNRYGKLLSLLKCPLLLKAIYQALLYLKTIKPDYVVTFGSFNAVPVAYAAFLSGIPVILHEQTLTVGLANKLIAPIAALCAVSYPDTQASFPKHKTHVTGNLLRKNIWNPPQSSPFPITINKPILYITGGNQGSQTINHVIFQTVNTLLERYEIFWQIGKWSQPENLPAKITRKSWFEPEESSWLMHHAATIVSRSGANTVAEITATGIPSILIPLPGSSGREQELNAALISGAAAGIIINQTDWNSSSFLKALGIIETGYSQFKARAKQLCIHQNPQAVAGFYNLIHQHAR